MAATSHSHRHQPASLAVCSSVMPPPHATTSGRQAAAAATLAPRPCASAGTALGAQGGQRWHTGSFRMSVCNERWARLLYFPVCIHHVFQVGFASEGYVKSEWKGWRGVAVCGLRYRSISRGVAPVCAGDPGHPAICFSLQSTFGGWTSERRARWRCHNGKINITGH